MAGTASMGGKRVAQKDGGKPRSHHHTGKSNWEGKLAAERREALENELAAKERCKALENELAAKEEALATERGKTSALENEFTAKIETPTKELAEERGKTSALQAEVHDLSSRVRHLSDLSQRQHLDTEWLTGLKRDGGPTPSRLMRRNQR